MKFRLKTLVDAVQVTEVTELPDGTFANPGDWVIDGKVRMPPKAFEAIYETLNDPSDAP